MNYQLIYVLMTDELKKAQYNAAKAAHANGAAQYLYALFCGRLVTREQTRDMADFVLPQKKRNMESCLFASLEEKEADIHRKENLVKMLKLQTGL